MEPTFQYFNLLLLRALSFTSAPFIFNNWYILQIAVDLQDQYPCLFLTK